MCISNNLFQANSFGWCYMQDGPAYNHWGYMQDSNLTNPKSNPNCNYNP